MSRGFVFGVLRAPLVVFGVVTLTFAMLHGAPGDPVALLLGPAAAATDHAAATRALGLDQPLAEQYLRWIARAIRGDFGTSIATGRPVARMLWDAWPATAILVSLSIVISYLAGVLLATHQAITKSRAIERAIAGLTITLAAIPGYWLAFILVMTFGYWLRWFPAFGAAGIDADFLGPGGRLLDRLAHLALPLTTLSLVGLGTVTRYALGSLRIAGHEQYLLTARAKGLGPLAVTLRHHLRNGLVPVVALLGLSLPALFSGAVFIEGVFAWPGVGQLLIQGVQARDYPVVMAATTVSAILVVVGSVLAEQLLHRIDPRTRPG